MVFYCSQFIASFYGRDYLLCILIVLTAAVLGDLYACVLYFCICTCSAQLSMFYMEMLSRNITIIIVIVSIIIMSE